MVDLKSEIKPSDSVAPEDGRMVSMTLFYHAEKRTFFPNPISGKRLLKWDCGPGKEIKF